MRLDALDQHAAEDVGPSIVGAQCERRPWPPRRRARRGRPRRRVDRRQQIDAGDGGRKLRPRSPARARRTDRAACRGSEASRAGRARRLGQQRRAILHQRLVRLVRPVPFQHGEFGMMQRAALAVAEDAGEIENPRLARRQQLLAGEFRRGAQIERRRARRPARSSRWRRRADGSRCRARPAGPRFPPRRNRRPRTRPRMAATMRPRASRNGRRSAWMSGQPERRALPSIYLREPAQDRRRKTGIPRRDRYGAARTAL